jgi:hypothetical protein
MVTAAETRAAAAASVTSAQPDPTQSSEHYVLHPLTVLAVRAEALALLVDAGEMDLDEAFERMTAGTPKAEERQRACPTCGAAPCVNPSFCRQCKTLDRKLRAQGGRPQPDPPSWDSMSVEALWGNLNDPRRRPTPKVTIEALMWCVRERGLSALREPVNIERLTRCDAAAKAQIDERIAKLIAGGVIPS